MRLAMVHDGRRAGLALAEGETPKVIWSDDEAYPGSLDDVIGNGGSLTELTTAFSKAAAADVAGLRFLPPLARPRKIICVGLNYRDHAEESNVQPPSHPEIFLRVTSSLVGHDATFDTTPLSDNLDYEAELVAIIGRTGKDIAPEDALNHVAAYSIFNDITLRDYQFRTSQWIIGKNFDGTGAFGPWLVTADDLPPGARGLRIATVLNGETVQDANTDNLIFDVATLVSDLSGTMTLEPGDMIVTGTPGGVGMARRPPLWMKAGDIVEVTIDRIGTLRTHIA